ncbi:hypothetical protein UGMREWDR_CDS0218 [Aeromonas phage GomatiRiver_11]|nr:hypothetical protein UGMREWDR_CDS0218 [Aeromonas phage GomatiRiver_11]
MEYGYSLLEEDLIESFWFIQDLTCQIYPLVLNKLLYIKG